MSQASKVRHLSLLLLALGCNGAGAAPSGVMVAEPLEEVRAAAEQAVRAQLVGTAHRVHVQAFDLDPRLHLARCPQPLSTQIGAPELSAHVTVRVGCAAREASWTIFVPVALESEVPVLVLRQSESRGTRVPAEAVLTETRRIQGMGSEYVSDVSLLAHRTLVRDVPAGTALTGALFQADYLVRQGQAVTLVAAAPGVEVRAPATALEDGREGGRVHVQNLASQKVVQGVVDASGLIYVTP
jgi:flagellar basal body P-ring formation protein FlgA